MSSKPPISGQLSGKENAPARPKTLHDSMLAVQAHLEAHKKAENEKKAASRKRKAPGPPVDEASVDLDVFNVEDVPMTENCDQVRRKINRMLDAGGMTKTAFATAIGVSMKSLANFLAMHGAFKGANSASAMAGLKLPVKKAAKMAKMDDAATPTSISTASTPNALAGAKKTQISGAGVDISAIHPDGEENDSVPIFDSCDEVRRKINAHLKKPGVTQAQFCRDILARTRPANIQSTQLARFRGMKGALTGAGSSVFYGAYVLFEKIRLAEGKPNTQHRLDMEAFWSGRGVVSRERQGRVLTEWRVMNHLPGTDDSSHLRQELAVMEPFTPAHTLAAEPLTEPPVGFLDIKLANLEDLEDKIWPNQHAHCYDFDADPPPSACDECGIPAYRAPRPLWIGAGAGGCPFVTVGDHVRELGAWLESEPAGRDVRAYLTALDSPSVSAWTAIPSQNPRYAGLKDVRFTVFSGFEAYEKAKWMDWAEELRTTVDERKQWAERS
ncbi:hypothetical protein B0T18DRAFT_426345 [Schizothecium vesticola]|uniref:DUF7726 domain-containing protein n=1 Tax=Schizothecium vesticola TaxID=314040 RepID=A0AA40F5U9_9PEZI|nr:hypothetical protein B0T18DRAFT_426345 [Schizothecium vesticola]